MLENEYIVSLVDKLNGVIKAADTVKEEYINLGQVYADNEKIQEKITSSNENVPNVKDLEADLEKTEKMTYEDYLAMNSGAPTEEEFNEWKKTRIEIMEKNIVDEKKRRENEAAYSDQAKFTESQSKMDTASDKYDEVVETFKKSSEKIKTSVERTIKRLQIRIDELDEEIKDIFDDLQNAKDKDEKIRLSKQLEKYRTMKIGYEANLKSIKDIRGLLAKMSNSLEDVDTLESIIKESQEKVSEIEGRISRTTEEIEVDITRNKDTGKYVVNCKCSNFELNPGKEYGEEELTKENISKLLKGFAGALANNRVTLSKDGKVFIQTSFQNAAVEIVEAAKDMDKTQTITQEEPTKDEPEQNIQPEQDIQPEQNNVQESPVIEDEPTVKDFPAVVEPIIENEPTVKDLPAVVEPELSQTQEENLNPQSEVQQDEVVLRVMNSRKVKKTIEHVVDGAVVAGGVALAAIAANPLLGCGLAVGGMITAKVITSAAYAHKTRKIRKTLKDIAAKAGLQVVVDHDSKSVFFCINSIEHRITSEEELNTLKAAGLIPQDVDLQAELDKAFNNAERETATPEEIEAFRNNPKATKIPLSLCKKVTLDNLEAAYQEVGGVHNRFGKINPAEVARKFNESIKPEMNTEASQATVEDAFESEKTQETPTAEETVTPEKTEDVIDADAEVIDVEQSEVKPVEEQTTVEQPEIKPEEEKIEEPQPEQTPDAVNPSVEPVKDPETITSAEELMRELENATVADELMNEEAKGMKL